MKDLTEFKREMDEVIKTKKENWRKYIWIPSALLVLTISLTYLYPQFLAWGLFIVFMFAIAIGLLLGEPTAPRDISGRLIYRLSYLSLGLELYDPDEDITIRKKKLKEIRHNIKEVLFLLSIMKFRKGLLFTESLNSFIQKMTDLIKRLETVVNKKRIAEISEDTINQLFSLTEYVYNNPNNLNDEHFTRLDACLESLKDLAKKESIIDLYKGWYERRSPLVKSIIFLVLCFLIATLVVNVAIISLQRSVSDDITLLAIITLGGIVFAGLNKSIVR